MNHTTRRALVEPLENRVLLSATSALPRPDHVVVLIEEDHTYSQLFGPPPAGALQLWPVTTPGVQTWDPHLRQLERFSASFTNAHSVGSTNAIDYQSIFSGLKPGRKDRIPATAPNLASELTAAGLSFGGFAEGLPAVGYSGGSVGDYSTSHNPWLPFTNFPTANNMPFAKFPDVGSALPTVSYVVPNQIHNMHSGSVNMTDQWYQSNIAPYAHWAMKNNSLLIVTWDESHTANHQVPALFYGPMVRPGHYRQPITQDNILRTLEDIYGLAPTGAAANATPITGIFKSAANAPASPHVIAHHLKWSAPFSDTPIVRRHAPDAT